MQAAADMDMNYDVVIVGAGPAGLAAAIRLRQLATETGFDISVCVLDKAAQLGLHTLSGAVIDPIALDELLPDWRNTDAPLRVKASQDEFWLLTKKGKVPLPVLAPMRNEGCYVASLAEVVRWLGALAETLGADVITGYPATCLLEDDAGAVCGVATGAMGLDKDGKPGANHEPGVSIGAKYTLLAEGCRGSLAEAVIAHRDLRTNRQPQTYGIGVKELWEVPASVPGQVIHTLGWPLDNSTYGGSFIYHLDENQIALGLVVGLDYANPTLSPYQELQRLKHHPAIATMLAGGKRIAYGARALNEGGWQSIPKLAFPGGLLIGCCAGFLDVARIKGTHTAMKSGMLAAEQIAVQLSKENPAMLIESFEQKISASWVGQELRKTRNVRPGFKKGLWLGMLNAAFELMVTRGKSPWTLRHDPDHSKLAKGSAVSKIEYPKPDGILSFDLLTNLAFAGVNHREGQPCHLVLQDDNLPTSVNLASFAGPEQYYCPAGVYEYVGAENERKLQINAQNCIHCKACDIKDPMQNIKWQPPEGGGGPNYTRM